ncbi:MAG: uroporphyrinogen decarboxylase family protein [Chloroflexota bacterium]
MAKTDMTTAKKWSEMTWQERREERFKRWLSPRDVRFVSPAAEKAYKERVSRFIKAIKLEEADRVPVILPAGYFPAFYAGVTYRTVMYDYAELKRSWLKFLHEFDMDSFSGPGLVFPGKILEALDVRTQKWPGHGMAADAWYHQFVEGEYMKADEYDRMMADPTDYTLRVNLPRTNGLLEPLARLGALRFTYGGGMRLVAALTDPGIRRTFQTLMDLADEYEKWREVVREVGDTALAEGVPNIRGGGMAGAPFDMFADALRGTHGIVMDMYRQPDKLIEAMDRMTPLMIDSVIAMANPDCPVVMMPLHKGDDTFMSDKQFDKFYWPTFRKLLLAMINEGLVPFPFAEGRYNSRLKQITDMPRGSIIWYFDQTDMAGAKKVLGDVACIAGNVPSSLLVTGTPEAVKENCRRLIEDCAPGGGFILTGGAGIDKGNPDNLRVMMDAAREYGSYK